MDESDTYILRLVCVTRSIGFSGFRNPTRRVGRLSNGPVGTVARVETIVCEMAMTDSSPTALSATFNAADVEAFLETRVTERNRQRCMRVILNLITGKGETHMAKPGEAFLKGHAVTPSDDLDDLQRRAREWLPFNGPGCLDKGHGWALNHPIQKLIIFQEAVFEDRSLAVLAWSPASFQILR